MRTKQRARAPPPPSFSSSSSAGTPGTVTLPETARLTLENTRLSSENTHLRDQVARLNVENSRLTAENEQLVQCRDALRAGAPALAKKEGRVLRGRGQLVEQQEEDDGAKDLRAWDLHVEELVGENEELKRKVARIEGELGCLRAAGTVAFLVTDVDGPRPVPGLSGGGGAGAVSGAENAELSAANLHTETSLAEDQGASVRAEQESANTYLKVPKKNDVSLQKDYPHHLQEDTSPRAPQLDHKVPQFPPTEHESAEECTPQRSPEVAQADTESTGSSEEQANAELATMREQLQRVRAELQGLKAKNEVLDAAGRAVQKENAGYLWLKYCENASLSRHIAELEQRLEEQTSEAREAKESLSQMATRLWATMNGLDAADLEKKHLQLARTELELELARTKTELTSELARAKMDIKFKTCEIANLKSRNTQRSQLLRAVQDELEMRRLNDQELMQENERMLSLLAKANEAKEANEANKANKDEGINEENEPNGENGEEESNEEDRRNRGNNTEEVGEVDGVNGVNSVQDGEHGPDEKNEGEEKSEGDEKNEGNEDKKRNQENELAEEVMEEASDFVTLDKCGGSQRQVDEVEISR